tara:strand:+ start:6393 stop:6599 length:207 start_codon:yes stop_codon:yes gene_type:complete
MTTKTWAIYTDLSGVGQVVSGDGGFATEADANARLIEMLEGRKADIADKLAAAKRRRATLRNILKGQP